LFDPTLYRFQELLFAEGLGKELNCAGLHGSNRHRDVAVSGDENDRKINLRSGKLFLKIQPAKSGKSNVKHKASGYIRTFAIKEGSC
jgi:hypothetical protein